VLIGRNDGIRGDWIRAFRNIAVICLHSEQGFADPRKTVGNLMVGHPHPRPPAHGETNVMAVINEETAGHLEEHLPDGMVRVVGYTRLVSRALATAARPISHTFTVGIACGPDVLQKKQAYDSYGRYLGEGSQGDEWTHIGTLEKEFSFYAIEWAWLNWVSEFCKDRYNTVVRYRLTDNSYLNSEAGITVDMTDSLHTLFEQSDVLIVGSSTVAIEAMMVGIPTISVVDLFNKDLPSASLKEENFLKYCWRPESPTELADLLEERRTGSLEISPRLEEFRLHAKSAFFAGHEEDQSAETLVDIIQQLEISSDPHIALDQLTSLILFPTRTQKLMKVIQSFPRRSLYHLLLVVLKARNRFYRRGASDHGSFLPSFRGDGCPNRLVKQIAMR